MLFLSILLSVTSGISVYFNRGQGLHTGLIKFPKHSSFYDCYLLSFILVPRRFTTAQTAAHASYIDIQRQMVILWPDSCSKYPYQKRAAPPRPPMVTSISPSLFKSISPCTDWPKNFTFSPSPPDAIRCKRH